MDIVSACLVGVKCRYDGETNTVESLKEKFEKGELMPICPEVLGGLKTPRDPAEIVMVQSEKYVMTGSGEDVTEAFVFGAYKTLEIAKTIGAKCAYLKSKSPSCGCHKIYDGHFSRTLIKGRGITAQLLLEHGITVMDEEGNTCEK